MIVKVQGYGTPIDVLSPSQDVAGRDKPTLLPFLCLIAESNGNRSDGAGVPRATDVALLV